MDNQHIMTHDIVEDHGERISNLKKYYPFFRLTELSFSQFREGRYDGILDMGYITLAVLRFFIEENNFKEKEVLYPEYEAFLRELLRRDFDMDPEKEEFRELAAYIFDKLRNEGRPFSFSYFDPVDKKKKTARLRLIENKIVDGVICYHITSDAVELYLDTKEIKDESPINVEQLLLEKLIKAQNFRGGTEVVRRINNEVSRLKSRKNQILSLLSYNVFEGMKAYEEFLGNTVRWFDEEQKLFVKNMDLIEKALSRAEAGSFYKSIQELYSLELELKKAVRKHSELLKECTDLQMKADQIITKAKVSALRSSFDFQSALRRAMDADRADWMEAMVKPLLALNIRKTFSLHSLDDLLTYRNETNEEAEALKEGEEQAYIFEDEVEEERIEENYSDLLELLAAELLEKGSFTLEEFNRTLIGRYGEEVFRNGDYYSFLIHINQKKEYDTRQVRQRPDTFFEEIMCRCLEKHGTPGEELIIRLTPFGEDEPQLTLMNIFEVSNMRFEAEIPGETNMEDYNG